MHPMIEAIEDIRDTLKSKADKLHDAYAKTPHPRRGWPKGKPRRKKTNPDHKIQPSFDNSFEKNLFQVVLGLTELFLNLKLGK